MDALSTWWVTPELKLEGNPAVKRFGWSFVSVFSLLFLYVGYFDPSAGIVIGTLSCLMGLSNMHMAFISRHAPDGENALRMLHARAMHRCSSSRFVMETLLLLLPAAILGLMILLASGFAGESPASDVGYGVLAWCVAVLFQRLVNWARFRRALRRLAAKKQGS